MQLLWRTQPFLSCTSLDWSLERAQDLAARRTQPTLEKNRMDNYVCPRIRGMTEGASVSRRAVASSGCNEGRARPLTSDHAPLMLHPPHDSPRSKQAPFSRPPPPFALSLSPSSAAAPPFNFSLRFSSFPFCSCRRHRPRLAAPPPPPQRAKVSVKSTNFSRPPSSLRSFVSGKTFWLPVSSPRREGGRATVAVDGNTGRLGLSGRTPGGDSIALCCT